MVEIHDLVGKTFDTVYAEQTKFVLANSQERYEFFHDFDCCEQVYLNDIVGDIDDLIGTPILQSEEVNYEHCEVPAAVAAYPQTESFTWTFYKFATIKGSVTLRWVGESNGYYSESVNLHYYKL